MTSSSRLLASVRVAALALSVLAAAAPLAVARPAYPSGWDTNETVPPATTYQFIPGGDRLHEAANAPVQAAQTSPSDREIYQMVPGGSRYHRVDQ